MSNALVESKNGNVVRRWLGHSHIPERLAPQANAFLRDFLSPFLNHHRACLFAIEVEGEGGRPGSPEGPQGALSGSLPRR